MGFSLTVATGGKFDLSIAAAFKQSLDFDLQGLMNLAGGFLFSAMFLTAITVYFIDHDFPRIILWSITAAVFAYFGLIHSGTIIAGQFTDHVAPGAAWQFSLGYLMIAAMAGIFMLQRPRRETNTKEKKENHV